jgi:predicted RNA-binding protein with TRAM domain
MSYTRRYGGSNFGSKPVETGKEYNVQITETGRSGDGIARIRGFVIFVKNAQIGQDMKAKVTSVGERFATAEIVV